MDGEGHPLTHTTRASPATVCLDPMPFYLSVLMLCCCALTNRHHCVEQAGGGFTVLLTEPNCRVVISACLGSLVEMCFS